MNHTLKTIFIILISSGIFTISLTQLYKMNPRAFSFIDKVPERWKGKWFIRCTVLLFLMFILSIITVIGGMNDTIGTIIIGFLIAFTDLVFSKTKRTN